MSKLSNTAYSSVLTDLIYKRDEKATMNYPSPTFVGLLYTVQKFIENAVPKLPRIGKRKCLEKYLVPALRTTSFLSCPENENHCNEISEVICRHFISIILKSIASSATEMFERPKYLNSKPLNRKVLRV